MATTKTILITGASSGIGRDAALALAARGHTVIAAARRLAPLETLRDAASAGAIVPLVLDVDDAESIARAAATVAELTGGRGVDALVNNAGFATAGALVELPDAALRAQFETNVFGTIALIRALAPAMMARGGGRIVNVSSVSGRIPAPVLGAYHASKYALEALSDALRMELHPFGVRVSIVEPGTIRTEFAARATAEASASRVAGSRYAALYDRTAQLEATFARVATDSRPVVRAIVHAIDGRRPRARYVAPRRFYLAIALFKLLPTCTLDALSRRAFGLTRRALGLDRGARRELTVETPSRA